MAALKYSMNNFVLRLIKNF